MGQWFGRNIGARNGNGQGAPLRAGEDDEERAALRAGEDDEERAALRAEQHTVSLMGQCGQWGSQCWACCTDCFGVTWEGLKHCCCGIWSFLCCFCCWPALMGKCSQFFAEWKVCCKPCCPLSKKFSLRTMAFAHYLDAVAITNTAGILTLNMYCATFFLSWGVDTSICISKTETPTAQTVNVAPAPAEFPEGVKTWMKVIVVGLPFTMLPVTAFVAGHAKALQKDLRTIGFVSGAVLLEALYVICLGGLMAVCMSAASWVTVSVVTGSLSAFVVLSWGCCCYTPKCLRTFVRNLCCWDCNCEQVDDIEALAEVALAQDALQQMADAATAAAGALRPPVQPRLHQH